MSVLKLFLTHILPAKWLEEDTVSTSHDPLLHPDIRVMTLAELADLPLMPENLGRTIPQPVACLPERLRCA
ncbi:hypothetical protein DTW90_10790 [Neorhizobium sp. P12A]|uniref:hypothetical protein n=1 Tax=Rhizobium/Agrobacterium group TaxID=227290 RepID=UPI0010477FCD|nr:MULTISPECIES: hypothetical protein [Rhizobium/Agrobacterium group]KAA0699817.1 hypothetical protein DTW90_10790 [Neorhizobium sp. P12A]TCR93364.1 hypothetical protein EV561_101810 [Rhizobium sp. BK376]